MFESSVIFIIDYEANRPFNLQEARALLGRLEYQKGNIEAALHVFEGIDIAAVTPKMKLSISRKCEQNRRHSQSDAVPPMSMHAVSLLLEAIFLKAKSLQGLGRYGGIPYYIVYFSFFFEFHAFVL